MKVYKKEEHDLTVKTNLLDFLNQLDVIDMDLWEEVAMPLESRLGSLLLERNGLFKGKL